MSTQEEDKKLWNWDELGNITYLTTSCVHVGSGTPSRHPSCVGSPSPDSVLFDSDRKEEMCELVVSPVFSLGLVGMVLLWRGP